MTPVKTHRRVFISVAEHSADMHAAVLVRTARQRLPDVDFYGLTGPALRDAGAASVGDLTAHAAMLTGILGNLGRGWRTVRMVERLWRAQRPDLIVLMDSGTLHLPMARRARRLGIPVLYYIAPQTWASRAYRNRTLATCVDHVACILPFEPAWFARAGVRATFVGHPLFEALRGQSPDRQTVERLRRGDTPLVAVLPGSRRHVISTMLPLELAVLARLHESGLRPRVAISAAAPTYESLIRDAINRAPINAEIISGDSSALLAATDLVLATSGTATLHAAHFRKPMVVMYDAGSGLYWPYQALGRWVIKAPHLCLVNLLADRRVVPEFMPFVRDLDAVARVVADLLVDTTWRAQMVSQLDQLVRPLENTHASQHVCDLIADLLNRQQPPEPNSDPRTP